MSEYRERYEQRERGERADRPPGTVALFARTHSTDVHFVHAVPGLRAVHDVHGSATQVPLFLDHSIVHEILDQPEYPQTLATSVPQDQAVAISALRDHRAL
jgi:hypothetical protein